MKVPASTSEKTAPAKSQPLLTPPPEPGPRRSEEREYETRYVALPRRRERGQGRRNLIGAVILLVFGVLLLGWAIYLAGPRALLTIAACLATATLLHVMARARLFRQRNGAFVAWAGVVLLGVMLVILHHGWLFLAGETRAPVANRASVPAEPAVPLANLPLLRTAFPVKGDPVGPALRVTRDAAVIVVGKTYLAKPGEVYPLLDVGLDDFRIAVAGHETTVPKLAGELVGSEQPASSSAPPIKPSGEPEIGGPSFVPSPDLSPSEQLLASHKEAIRRYPELGQLGTEKNRAFLAARKELYFSGHSDFFKDTNWPLILAEDIAQKDGWPRADVAQEAPPPRTR